MRSQVDVFLQESAESWRSFTDPALIVECDAAESVRSVVADVERLTRDRQLHAVGFLTYEAGAAFGFRMHAKNPRLPVAWFALFEPQHVRALTQPETGGEYTLGTPAPSLDRTRFDAAFASIRAHLAAGDTYQANFTFKVAAPFSGDPLGLFTDLVDAQQGQRSLFIRTGGWAICSASPELFFELDGVTVRARPMKGTSVRGRTPAEDLDRRTALRESAKQQAENVMIVDMVRNDLGRIADVGSIEVPELFAVERYPNVWQMTSLVTGRSLAPLEEVFAALHPSASVTGAPKQRTVDILTGLEDGPRGVYTGAIGHIRPDGNAAFNVAIRTAVVDLAAGVAEFGVGSGIVWDSDPAAEYEECLLKASVFGRRPIRFELLETLRWTAGEGFALLEPHLTRLSASAGYFGYRCDLAHVRDELARAVQTVDGPQRVRLLVARDGTVRIECAALAVREGPVHVVLAGDPVDSRDVSLFHKTTNRSVYERARARAGSCDDVILWNERGELTESTIANVVVELDGAQYTPPVECGLLAGTYRAELLERGEIQERVITREELKSATGIWLINSVQGRMPGMIVGG